MYQYLSPKRQSIIPSKFWIVRIIFKTRMDCRLFKKIMAPLNTTDNQYCFYSPSQIKYCGPFSSSSPQPWNTSGGGVIWPWSSIHSERVWIQPIDEKQISMSVSIRAFYASAVLLCFWVKLSGSYNGDWCWVLFLHLPGLFNGVTKFNPSYYSGDSPSFFKVIKRKK